MAGQRALHSALSPAQELISNKVVMNHRREGPGSWDDPGRALGVALMVPSPKVALHTLATLWVLRGLKLLCQGRDKKELSAATPQLTTPCRGRQH